MTPIVAQPIPPPPPPPFQFRLRTLLLLCVVLGSSLAVFGGWGIFVFVVAVELALWFRTVKLMWPLAARLHGDGTPPDRCWPQAWPALLLARRPDLHVTRLQRTQRGCFRAIPR